ncbi:hypothetical protein B0A58_06905 [Flavobacterium branchiophilum NBRC 15030 = ATCC 35035]|uniref:Uncharacterized protein n=1 Tax=Flavobacterium branchiophilum TaxID=55197 RepID=A0A543G8Q0_9FLAO|nr:hypothetical protein B0A58_06905 [Flavobacterium branchiophilum NBRC 15030 = ATCC 35035]TQM42466.1 hypothetical protein BC670_3529 [Flavobacterium branchiophilum]GEM54142.1 hypothetical protein FB1_03630 [Flavobacterium branchiophilum NBRC 15030 = ATCC 35035]
MTTWQLFFNLKLVLLQKKSSFNFVLMFDFKYYETENTPLLHFCLNCNFDQNFNVTRMFSFFLNIANEVYDQLNILNYYEF